MQAYQQKTEKFFVSEEKKFGRIDSQVSISSTFFEQLLHLKIPKAQKDTDDLTDFLWFWDLLSLQRLCVSMLMKSTPSIIFIKI